jgi:hypothetical protein
LPSQLFFLLVLRQHQDVSPRFGIAGVGFDVEDLVEHSIECGVYEVLNDLCLISGT